MTDAPSSPGHKHGRHTIRLVSGAYFDAFDTSPESVARVTAADVIAGLRGAVRWRGQTGERVTVARHTVAVVQLVAAHPRGCTYGQHPATVHALLHDAAEAFLGDVPTPQKRHPAFAAYREAEDALQEALSRRFGVEPECNPDVVAAIADADLAAMIVEARVHHDVDPLREWGVPASAWVHEAVAAGGVAWGKDVQWAYSASGRLIAGFLTREFAALPNP